MKSVYVYIVLLTCSLQTLSRPNEFCRELTNKNVFDSKLLTQLPSKYGHCFIHGDSVKKDVSTGISLFEKGIKDGNPQYNLYLGFIYKGYEGEQYINYEKAAKYLRKATEANVAGSFIALGDMYEKGLYFKSDLNKALQLYVTEMLLEEKYGEPHYKSGAREKIKQLSENNR